jgi:heme/copper-type cytochrome/quinol oxidase subunit 1
MNLHRHHRQDARAGMAHDEDADLHVDRLCTNVLIVARFPVLTAVLRCCPLDRYVGTHFFTNELGGNPMMYVNLIWIWGHPRCTS